MSLAELEAELETFSAFKSQVEDLALVEVSRLEGEEESLANALKSVREELTAARRVLGAVTPPKPKLEKTPHNQSRVGAPKTISPHRRDELMAFLTNNVNEFGVKEAQEALGWAESQVATALLIFREEGLIRLARMGGKTGSTKFYRSMVGGT